VFGWRPRVFFDADAAADLPPRSLTDEAEPGG